MRNREPERLIREGRQYLAHIKKTGDGSVLRTRQVRSLVQRLEGNLSRVDSIASNALLFQEGPSIESFVAARQVVGWLQWLTSCELTDEDGRSARGKALEAFIPCHVHGIDPIPEPLLPELTDLVFPLALAWGEGMSDLRSVDFVASLWTRLVETGAPVHPHSGMRLMYLAGALGERARLVPQGEAAKALDTAVAACRRAVAETPAQYPERAQMFAQLGLLLLHRFVTVESRQDIKDARLACEEGLSHVPPGHPYRLEPLVALASTLFTASSVPGLPDDLDQVVALCDEAATLVEPGHPRYGEVAKLLAAARASQSGRRGTPAPADETAAVSIDVRRLLSNGDDSLALYWETGNGEQLDEAVRLHERALALAAGPSEDRWRCLMSLGRDLGLRFTSRGRQQDVTRATGLLEEALAATPVGHPRRASSLKALAVVLRERYEWIGTPQDLERATAHQEEALALLPRNSPTWVAAVGELGTSYLATAEATADIALLDRAIACGETVLASHEADDPHVAAACGNLAIALMVRHETLHVREDLERAITVLEHALEVTPHRHPHKPRILTELAAAYFVRYHHDKDPHHITMAIQGQTAALNHPSQSAPEYARRLSRLATYYAAKFTAEGDPAYLSAAATTSEQALAAAPAGRRDRPQFLALRARILLLGLKNHGNEAIAHRAIGLLQEALDALPDDHPIRGGLLVEIGGGFSALAGEAAAAQAAESFAAAARLSTVAPSTRITAARRAAWVLARTDPDRAAELLALAVDLLPRTIRPAMVREDQQGTLGNLAGLADDAAALTLARHAEVPPEEAAERAMRALTLLEQGRGVLLNQALDLRSEVAPLRESPNPGHHRLAEEYEELRRRLDADDPATTWPYVRALGDRHAINQAFDDVVRRIRAVEGFAGFHRPPSPEELLAQARRGPVAVFFTSHYGSGALVLTPTALRHVPLPELTLQRLVDNVNSFHGALHTVQQPRPAGLEPAATEAWLREWRAEQGRLSVVLEWLWDAAARPVLDAIAPTHPQSGRVPRIWWVPSGMLGQLPLHAAGRHPRTALTGAPPAITGAVMDEFVSSYAPTVRGLAHSRRRQDGGGSGRALVVAMPVTAGGQPLGHVEAEVAVLREWLPDHVLLSTTSGGVAPTTERVRAELPSCTVAHFACHGVVHHGDPSLSRLVLADDHEDPFIVAALSSVELGDARLAYLSACDTAAARVQDLLDESIHLTSAFQLAGFRHVVGTQWPLMDKVTVDVARAFYGQILDDAGRLPDGEEGDDRIAAALHRAVSGLRERYPDLPSIWASYVHAGA